jgi:ABC-type transport system involved in multi-copper enzyme maturation permease subunit
MLSKSWIMARTEIRMVFKSRQVKTIPIMIVTMTVLFAVLIGWLVFGLPLPPGEGDSFFNLLMTTTMGMTIIMLPVILPVMIAAESIVGEKERHTLVPLLATPLTDSELLLGKFLTALIPGLVVAYANLTLSIGLVNLMALLFNPTKLWLWPNLLSLLQALVMPPLFTLLAVGITVPISGRVTKVYEAYQTSTIIVFPALIFAYAGLLQGTGLDWTIFIAGVVALLIADAGLFRLARNLFSRDRLTSRR